MYKVFFRLSGKYPSLPLAELKAILESLEYEYKILEEDSCIVLIELDKIFLEKVIERAAYTKAAYMFLSIGKNYNELIENIEEETIERFIPKNVRFEVRVKRILGAEVDTLKMEKMLGEILLKKFKEAKVDLTNPMYRIHCLVTPSKLYLGLLLSEKEKKWIHNRKPINRPFNLPSSLQPELARCMVNLVRRKPGSIILDPFAGTGSILIEAELMNYNAIGLELKRWICDGALKNIKHFLNDYLGIINADARYPPLRKSIDAIVTDPPYGRSATLMGKTLEKLLKEFFNSIQEILKKGAYICFAIPSEINLENIINHMNLRIIETYDIIVHGSLTRKVIVLQKIY
ncbi:MAG: DNA methyltransferase [Nitrososphaerota archaeon]